MTNSTTTTKRTGKIWKEAPLPIPNYTSIGADLISHAYKQLEGKSGVGQIYILGTHTKEVGILATKLKALKGGEDSVDKMCKDYIAATPEGADLLKRHTHLVELGKNKNKTQRDDQENMAKVIKNTANTLARACDCWFGLQRLIDAEVEYEFSRDPNPMNANIIVFNAWRSNQRDKQWLDFSAKQLTLAATASFTKETPVVDIFVACEKEAERQNKQNHKDGAANDQKGKGNGQAMKAGDFAAMLVDVDTTINSRYVNDDGDGLSHMTPSVQTQVFNVWALLDSLLSDKQKAAAKKAFAAEVEKEKERTTKAAKNVAEKAKAALAALKASKAKQVAKQQVNKAKSRKKHRRVS